MRGQVPIRTGTQGTGAEKSKDADSVNPEKTQNKQKQNKTKETVEVSVGGHPASLWSAFADLPPQALPAEDAMWLDYGVAKLKGCFYQVRGERRNRERKRESGEEKKGCFYQVRRGETRKEKGTKQNRTAEKRRRAASRPGAPGLLGGARAAERLLRGPRHRLAGPRRAAAGVRRSPAGNKNGVADERQRNVGLAGRYVGF